MAECMSSWDTLLLRLRVQCPMYLASIILFYRETVEPRSRSRRIPLVGIFPGAEVMKSAVEAGEDGKNYK